MLTLCLQILALLNIYLVVKLTLCRLILLYSMKNDDKKHTKTTL